MTDEELIARLRDEHVAASRTEAADRIEALIAERDEALEWLSASQGYIADAVYALDKQEAAEAKLAKAVNIATLALNAVHEVQTYEQPDDPWTENALTMREMDAFDFDVGRARATLAEIKGESHE